MNMCMFNSVVCIVLIAVSRVLSYTRRMFWWLDYLYDSWILLLGLYILDSTMLLLMCPSMFLVGGLKEPSM